MIDFEIDMKNVSGMPREIALVILEMYESVAAICANLDIPLYFIKRNWGDLGEGNSLAMFRPDYERFLKEADSLLDSKRYFLQDYRTDEFWTGPQARLRLHGSLMEDPVHADLAVHQGIYINIYPIDQFPKSPLAQSNLLKQYSKIQSELCATGMTDSQNWAKRIQKRGKIIKAQHAKNWEWFIIYPMVADLVNHCIININDLISKGSVSFPTPGDYDDWLFDLAEDL